MTCIAFRAHAAACMEICIPRQCRSKFKVQLLSVYPDSVGQSLRYNN